MAGTDLAKVNSNFPSLTYIGSLDDKVQDYPWRYAPSIEALNEQLICQALFGNPVLLNDGYFCANKVIHKSLIEGPESVIGALAQEGFLKIYMRDQGRDLMKGISDAAGNGVADHRLNLSDDEWNGKVRPYLEDLIPRMQWAGETWPDQKTANVGRIFYKLLESRIDRGEILQLRVPPTVLYETFKILDQRIDHDSFAAARTIWEKEAIPQFLKNRTEFDPAVVYADLMMLANEAYHFSHAIAAEQKFGNGKCGVQTALSTAFSDVVEQNLLPDDIALRHERAKRYLYCMPRKIRISGSGLRALTYQRTGIGLMKKEYIEGLDRYLLGRLDDSEMDKLYEAYRVELSDHLSRYEHVSELKSSIVGTAISVALGYIPNQVTGFLLSNGFSLGSATVMRWFRKRAIASELEIGRLEEMQNIPEAFRYGRPWRASMMAMKVTGYAPYLS